MILIPGSKQRLNEELAGTHSTKNPTTKWLLLLPPPCFCLVESKERPLSADTSHCRYTTLRTLLGNWIMLSLQTQSIPTGDNKHGIVHTQIGLNHSAPLHISPDHSCHTKLSLTKYIPLWWTDTRATFAGCQSQNVKICIPVLASEQPVDKWVDS